MDRRQFIRLAGEGALMLPFAGCCFPKQSIGTTGRIGVSERQSENFKRIGFMVRTTQIKASRIRALSLKFAGVDFSVRELMPELRGRLKFDGEDYEWLLLTPQQDFDDRSPWDRAHLLRRGGYRGNDPSVLGEADFIEPDLEHGLEFDFKRCVRTNINGRSAGGARIGDGFNGDWHPEVAQFAWHLEKSELRSARDMVGGEAGGIRIAILDVGYNKNHVTVPWGIQHDAEYDFVGGKRDASDPGAIGVLCNSGHGTGTIGILAGRKITLAKNSGYDFSDSLGGSPESQIIPVRIADSVIHFYSSAMADGITYALSPDGRSGKGATPCDVVSISMGGVPSEAWATAVNQVYEAGIVVVAASGNNFNGIPIRGVVWPARFRRVFPVCGATYDDEGYYTSKPLVMQGNYGPRHVMRRAVAAYTPNVTWAKWAEVDVVDLDGAGTSSATPQVAAACALWLAKNGAGYPKGWERVEAVREALMQGADKRNRDYRKFFGNGVLRAAQSLSIKQPSGLQEKKEDQVRFPILQAIFDQRGTTGAERRMYEVEAAQIAARSHEIEEAFPDWDDPDLGSPPRDTQDKMADLVVSNPYTSEHLRALLKGTRVR
jgi:hypothetical protein